MIARLITDADLGRHVTITDLTTLGGCRSGILRFYAHTSTHTVLVIGDHEHTMPHKAHVSVDNTVPVRGL